MRRRRAKRGPSHRVRRAAVSRSIREHCDGATPLSHLRVATVSAPEYIERHLRMTHGAGVHGIFTNFRRLKINARHMRDV
jgi:hypothetical protein